MSAHVNNELATTILLAKVQAERKGKGKRKNEEGRRKEEKRHGKKRGLEHNLQMIYCCPQPLHCAVKFSK